jgi:protein TonB
VALLPVLKKALAKEPAERYTTCRELALALREARAALERQVTDLVPAGASRSGAAPPAATAPGVADAAGEEEATRIVPGLKASRSSRPAPKEAQLLVAPLLKALKHADASVRAGAARALGRVGPDAGDTLSALTAAEQDEDEGVRAAAATAAARLRALPTPGSEVPTQAVSAVLPIVVPVAAPPVVAPVAAPEAPPFAPPQAPSPAPAPPPPPSPPESRPVALPSREAPAEPQQSPQSYRRRPALVFAPETPRSRLLVAFTAGASALACAGLVALWLSQTGGREAEGKSPPTLSTAPPASVAVVATPVPETLLPTTPVSLAPSPVAPPSASSRLPAVPATRKQIVTPASAPVPIPSVSVEPPPLVAEPTAAPELSPPTPTPEVPPQPTAAPPPIVIAPQCLSCPRPEYPLIALRRKAEGTVRLRLLIDTQGVVTKIEVVRGIDLLTDAAVNGAKRWRYRPGTRDGVAVASWIEVGVTFGLER